MKVMMRYGYGEVCAGLPMVGRGGGRDLTKVGNYTSHNPGGSGSRPSKEERVIHPVRTIIKQHNNAHSNTNTVSVSTTETTYNNARKQVLRSPFLSLVITSDSTLSVSRIPIGIVIS